MQTRKIGEYRQRVDALMQEGGSAYKRLAGLVAMLESNDQEAAYQADKLLSSCQVIRELFDGEFIRLCAALIGARPETTLLDGPGLFVNEPNVQRLLYKWHAESLYYPKRRRFVNVWLPVFGDRSSANGAMTVLPGSHRRVWDASSVSEYVGYDKDSENRKNHLLQLEIPANFLTDYTPHDCVSTRGDVILFDRALVHASNANTTSDVAFAVACRVWDPSDDLTLSGDIGCTPYRGDIGRAGLMVRP
jgi:hypothetical protein